MQSNATSVEDYLVELPEDRRAAIQEVRQVILKNLPRGIEEGMQYGMIGYFVPLSVYPSGYHCDPKQPLTFAAMASQKNHMAVYLFCIDTMDQHREWFVEAWTKTGKKLDMGKSCVRFKKLEDVSLEVIGNAVKRISVQQFIKLYESALPASKKATAKPATRKKSG